MFGWGFLEFDDCDENEEMKIMSLVMRNFAFFRYLIILNFEFNSFLVLSL